MRRLSQIVSAAWFCAFFFRPSTLPANVCLAATPRTSEHQTQLQLTSSSTGRSIFLPPLSSLQQVGARRTGLFVRLRRRARGDEGTKAKLQDVEEDADTSRGMAAAAAASLVVQFFFDPIKIAQAGGAASMPMSSGVLALSVVTALLIVFIMFYNKMYVH